MPIRTSLRPLIAAGLVVVLAALCGCKGDREPGAPEPGFSALPLLAAENFESGKAEGWLPKDADHWRVVEKDGTMAYELVAPGEQGSVRAPTEWSVWNGYDVTSFEFTGRMRCYTDVSIPGRDMCVFFHYQGPTHFAYVHFSAESADVHNIIGLVNGADRVKINIEPAGRSVFRMTDLAWHDFKVTCDASSGDIKAYLDDMTVPILTARDKTLGHGLVGVGAFDDAGCFDGLALRGTRTGR
jgi:hypothetical protein